MQRQVKEVKVDGVDPVQLNRVQDQTLKPKIQEGQRHEAGQKQRERVLAQDQQVVEWDISHLEELEKNVEQVNKIAETLNLSVRFRIHEESERVKAEVVDRLTDEVIREIPPERVLNMVAQIQSLIGLFIDTRR